MPSPSTRRQLINAQRVRMRGIRRAEKTIGRLRVAVAELDAAILANGGPIRAYTPATKPARRGGMAKAILGILRVAERPMTAGEVVDALVADGRADGVGRAVLAGRAWAAMKRQAANGTLVREKGAGVTLVWSVAK